MRIDVKTYLIYWCAFTGVHFPDLKLNSYDNLSNMKLDLNVSTKVKFSANDKGL